MNQLSCHANAHHDADRATELGLEELSVGPPTQKSLSVAAQGEDLESKRQRNKENIFVLLT